MGANIVETIREAHEALEEAQDTLRGAAANIANLIEDSAPLNRDLPRGYRVVRVTTNLGASRFLVKGDPFGVSRYASDANDTIWVDGTGGYLHGDFHSEVPGPTAEGLLEFARDVEDGLLEEIAEDLRSRAATMQEAAATLANSSHPCRATDHHSGSAPCRPVHHPRGVKNLIN